MTPRAAWSLLALAAGACAQGPPPPAALDTRSEICASCRMAVSDPRLAAQLVAPAEEPRFFDDLGCLAAYLRERSSPGRGARAYVADHRTRGWVPAGEAVYTRVPGLETPMASHLIAHLDAASRDADPVAKGGQPVAPEEVFGLSLPADLRSEATR